MSPLEAVFATIGACTGLGTLIGGIVRNRFVLKDKKIALLEQKNETLANNVRKQELQIIELRITGRAVQKVLDKLPYLEDSDEETV